MKTEKYTVERHLDDQGRLQSETWRLNDKLHRTDGPARIYYRPDGTVDYEQWWLHSQLHRADGPAYTIYWADGTVRYETWWMHGQLLTPEQRAAQTQPTDCVLDIIVEHGGKKYRLVPVSTS